MPHANHQTPGFAGAPNGSGILTVEAELNVYNRVTHHATTVVQMPGNAASGPTKSGGLYISAPVRMAQPGIPGYFFAAKM